MDNKKRIITKALSTLGTFIATIFLSAFAHDNSKLVHTETENVDSGYVEEVTEDQIIVEKNESNVTTCPNETDTESTEVESENTEETTNDYYCAWGDFSLTQEEYNLLLTTVYCESGNQPLETQTLTALVILNRLADNRFPNNLHDVIYAKGAFSVTRWKDFENKGWTEQVEKAVQSALAENNHPRDMFYFRTGHYHSWAVDYMKSGKVYFSTRN